MKKDLNESILSFFNIYNMFRKRMAGFADVTMSITEVGALHFINKEKQVTMKELSDFLEITPPSTTALINKLTKKNMLKRTVNKDDRRNVILSFTAKGEDMFKKAENEKVKIVKEIFSCLNEKESSELCSISQKIFKEMHLKNKN